MMSTLCIVGVFYKGYIDLWQDFVSLFKLHWADCPFDIKIVTNDDNDWLYEGIEVLGAGCDAEYSKKIQKVLKVTNYDYYLLLLEDFFFSETIRENALNSTLSFMRSHGYSYCALPLGEFSGSYRGKFIQNTQYRCLSSKSEYTVSCQPSIWKKEFLKDCIGNLNYNAWVFEGAYAMSEYTHSHLFLDNCIAETSNILKLKHGVLQGKFIYETYHLFLEHGYQMKSQREVLPKIGFFKKKVRPFFTHILPLSLRRFLRKRFPNKSIMGKYQKEIAIVMESLNI